MPIDQAPFHLSSEEVTVHSGCEVLMEADDNSALIVGDDPQGIFCQEFMPRPIELLTIIFIIIFFNYINYIIKLSTILSKGRNGRPQYSKSNQQLLNLPWLLGQCNP